MFKDIKNIIFDLGAVLLAIDFNATIKEFKALGFDNLDELYPSDKPFVLFEKFEKGIIEPLNFRQELSKMININITFDDIDEAWNKMILDYFDERINLVLKLKKSYRIFLLSNTNIIHYELYSKQFKLKYNFELKELFEKMYLSFELKMRKPDKEIFEYVIKNAKIIPEETLFIDDTEIHLKSASALGIKTLHLLPEDKLEIKNK